MTNICHFCTDAYASQSFQASTGTSTMYNTQYWLILMLCRRKLEPRSKPTLSKWVNHHILPALTGNITWDLRSDKSSNTIPTVTSRNIKISYPWKFINLSKYGRSQQIHIRESLYTVSLISQGWVQMQSFRPKHFVQLHSDQIGILNQILSGLHTWPGDIFQKENERS